MMAQSTPARAAVELLGLDRPPTSRKRPPISSRRSPTRRPTSSSSMADQAEKRRQSRGRAGPRGRRARAGGGRQLQGRRRQVGQGSADGHAGHGRRGRLRARRAVEVLRPSIRPLTTEGQLTMFRGLINDAKAAAGVAHRQVPGPRLGCGALHRRARLCDRGAHRLLVDRFGAITAYWMVAGGFTLIGLVATLVVTVKEQEEEVAETKAEANDTAGSLPTQRRKRRRRFLWRCSPTLLASPPRAGCPCGRRQDAAAQHPAGGAAGPHRFPLLATWRNGGGGGCRRRGSRYRQAERCLRAGSKWPASRGRLIRKASRAMQPNSMDQPARLDLRRYRALDLASPGLGWAFAAACSVVIVWAIAGPLFGYLGGLAARHQHRHHHRHVPDGVPDPEHPEPRRAGHPSEARRADPRINAARNGLIDLENCTDQELDQLQQEFETLRSRRLVQTEKTGPPGASRRRPERLERA